MPDRRTHTPRHRPDPLVAAAKSFAAAQTVNTQIFQYQQWQQEGWGYFRSVGELWYGLDWQANAISRVRLVAAEMVPSGDEPEPLEEGPAAELMQQFCGGTAGQAAFLKAISFQLGVPGEGWLVAERDSPDIPLTAAQWCVYSTDSFRQRGRDPAGNDILEVRIDETHWRPLLADALPIRVWEPDPQYPWLAMSAVQAAIPILRRIDLLDRRIIAMLVSRLAMNGILFIPQEGTFTVPPEFADAPDPFVALLIDIASKNIANPGMASAAIPLPMKFSAEFIEKFRHLAFGDPLDEQLLVERDKELQRLATTLKITTERLTGGMSQANHWSAWQMDEEEIQTSICPVVETICHALSEGFLQPMLMAVGASPLGPNGGKLLVWYDVGRLTAKPDNSTNAQAAYDRLEISPTAYRRETGFDEADMPTADELEAMGWRKLVGTVELGPTAIAKLTGAPVSETPVAGPPVGPGSGDGSAEPSAPSPATGPPATRENPAPEQQQAVARILRNTTSLVAGQETLTTLIRQAAPGDMSGDRSDDRPNVSNGRRPARHRR